MAPCQAAWHPPAAVVPAYRIFMWRQHMQCSQASPEAKKQQQGHLAKQPGINQLQLCLQIACL
jgi:hypothetical protein